MRALIFFFFLAATLSAKPLKVASFNPIATELLKQVGGDKIEIAEMKKKDERLNAWLPTPKKLKGLGESRLCFMMGKGFERYIHSVQITYGELTQIVEIGKSIPSQKVDSSPAYSCCPYHAKGTVLPHWWHNVKNMERAAKVVAKELGNADPENKEFYKKNSSIVGKRYRELDTWVKAQVRLIPKKARKLVTADSEFIYFCKAYGFEPIFVHGLDNGRKSTPEKLEETIFALKKKRVKAIFPERSASPKVLKKIARGVGCRLGSPLYVNKLISDSYEATIRKNINNIVTYLR